MKILSVFFVCLSFFKLCVGSDNVWFSYQSDPEFQNREELVITNITSEDTFFVNYPVKKWKSLNFGGEYYLAGVMDTQIVIIHVEIDPKTKSLLPKSTIIETENDIVEVQMFKHWNVSSQNFNIILLIATQKPDLLWYILNETNNILFWSWPMAKNISHINVFQIGYDYNLLIINKYLTHVTADLYLCHLDDPPNFWLRQKLALTQPASSSAAFSSGPDYFLAVPQKSLNLVTIYKFKDNHFVPHQNLSSRNVNNVVAFKIGQVSFLAINGLQAGIYKYTKKNFIKKSIVDSHLEGINYWLPIPLTVYGDDMFLMAQRALKHEPHKSFVIEIITYNGDKFGEHDDIPCLYFGENVLGLSCLPDEERGIIGATSIFLNDILFLLVPRKNKSSELFLVRWELKKNPHPLIHQIDSFVKRRNYINDLIQEQEKKYNKLTTKPEDPAKITEKLDEIDKSLRNMQARSQILEKMPEYDTVIFNGLVKIESGDFDSIEVEKINGEPTNATFEDLVLKNNLNSIPTPKIFKDLQVEDLVLEKVNGIDSSNLVFTSENVTINGSLFFEKPLTVSENVITSHYENPILEELFIPGNIEVDNLNGENFTQFLWELCLKNIKNKIPGTLEIKGDVKVTNAEINLLNNLRFPEEYVFVENTFPSITGKKYFLKSLTTDEIRTEIIDDIDTSRVITLDTPQDITGRTTFKNLKITESLNVEGSILGEHASKFLPNPTLFETNSVKARVNFKELEVEGAIVLSEDFNGRHFESILEDVVYDSEERPVIDGEKKFPEALAVRKSLTINSDMINNLHLESIVTKNTDQFLNISTINGVVTFGNVDTNGFYDGVDVSKLDEELVKLDGEQYISSTLIFEDGIDVNRLEVLRNVSLIAKVNESQFEDQLDVDNVIVEGNYYGGFDNFDWKNFVTHRMSLSEAQIVDADFAVGTLYSKNTLPIRINNFKREEFTHEEVKRRMITKLEEGNLSVINFHAKDSLEVDKINNKSIIGLGGSLWTHDIKKHNLSTLVFNDDVYFENLKIEKLSGVNFNDYVKTLLFKNETDVKIKGCKIFLQGCTVDKFVETQHLNSISLENILTKHGNQEISGPIIINGNVTFETDIKVFGNINDVPTNSITESYEVLDDQIRIKGDILFNRLSHIHNLKIQGYVDDRLVQDVLDGIIYTDGDIKLEGQITFEDNVNIEKNVRVIGKINNVDLPAFVSDMVMISKDVNIESHVKFLEPVMINESVIHDGLKTDTVNGIRIEDWENNAIFINKGFLKGNYIFEDVSIVDSLHTEYINDINIETLIPLRTMRNLTQLTFGEITLFKDVDVGNSTNYCNLPEEFANSVLTNTDQDIDSDVEFLGNVYVEGNLKVSGLVNGAGTNDIVTTNTEQDLHAVYHFKSKTNFEKNLLVDGFINGINVTSWSDEAVRVGSKYPQDIYNNWSVEQDLILEDDSGGSGVINGVNFEEFSRDVEEKRSFKYQMEKGFIDDYTNICKDLTFMYRKLKKQIYKFNYFEDTQVLNFQRKVSYVQNYKYQNNYYILVNEEKNCETYLFIFENNHFRYVKSIHFGLVEQIIFVYNNDLMYLVVRNQPFYSTCKVQGTNLWQVIDNDFVRWANMEDLDLVQESVVPGTFYGMRGSVLMEYRILADLESVRKYRKWEVNEANMAFVPRGFATGLALSTGRKLIRLNREDLRIDDFSYETENIIIGNYTEEFNTYFPGRKDSDFVVMNVGIKSNKRSLLGVASREETSVKGSLDFIKIYEDVITGKVFHKVPTYKPSSLVSLDCDNGETLLVFLEDESVLQVYEYKGIEGFKHKLSARLKGSKLFTLDFKLHKIIGVVDKNKISFMEAVMLGNQTRDGLKCDL